ncbi:cyclic nucleotide-binding domain-containing protein [Moorena sp. SIO3H5]|uniref:cyclic nucleotide-binding domain-containing protein n=1 Tax=Moorena sp. SIO3H5 TaxID=2607834 RepID=UPI0013BB7CF3|nr:cyclic nucleotide-binding domain-containing protein [Moorena sp. SIO3H5]NEO68762.1 mechanosensitive ion channel [Moorena sp. SIO3H5]
MPLDQLVPKFLKKSLFQLGEVPVSLLTILQLIFLFLIAKFLIQDFKKFLNCKLLNKLVNDPKKRDFFAKLISYTIFTVLVYIIYFIGGLDLIKLTIFEVGNTKVSIKLLIQLVLSLMIVIFLASTLKNFLKQELLPQMGIDEANRAVIATIISYAFGILGIVIVLNNNFELGSLAVIAGGLGVGIGFGLQDITKNFISGVTLLLERTIRVGDFIEFDGLSGYVKEVSMRSTIIRTREGGDVVVPNSHLVENRMLNWTFDSYKARIHIPVGVAYDSDPVLVTEVLLKSAYLEPSVLSEPTPRVLFKGFGDSALNFELRVWVNRIDQEPLIRSSLNFIIEYNLRQQGISIPFPQRDFWLRNPEALMGKEIHSQNIETVEQTIEESNQQSFKVKTPRPLALRDLLRQVDYFKNFTELELRQLIEIGYRKRLRPSEMLFHEGDPGDAFYIILAGSVEVFVERINKTLNSLQAGQFFGELSLMLGVPRTASVRALEESLLFVISNKGFKQLLKDYPDLSEIIVQELGKHQEELAERQKQMRKMGLLDAAEDDKNILVWVRKRVKRLFAL